jgi:hypothetical protein
MDVPDFDSVYRADPDPWRVRTSFYERRKLDVVLASLSSPSYAAAWDPAAGVGELVARLSGRVDRVLATDASVEAVRLSRGRCSELTNVEVRAQALPTRPPTGWGPFDLVVLSEFVYYLSPSERKASLEMLDSVVADRAELVSLHWRHQPHDAWLSGAHVQAEIGQHLIDHGWRTQVQHEDRDFVLSSFERGEP